MRAAVATVGRHVLPRGWFDLVRQSLIWFGFYFGYMAVRHLADRNPARAVAGGVAGRGRLDAVPGTPAAFPVVLVSSDFWEVTITERFGSKSSSLCSNCKRDKNPTRIRRGSGCVESSA